MTTSAMGGGVGSARRTGTLSSGDCDLELNPASENEASSVFAEAAASPSEFCFAAFPPFLSTSVDRFKLASLRAATMSGAVKDLSDRIAPIHPTPKAASAAAVIASQAPTFSLDLSV